jgi:hypothetical protein
MKTIIDIDEKGLCSLDLKKEKKQINWADLTRVEQLRLLKALSNFHELFSKFIKPEENENK